MPGGSPSTKGPARKPRAVSKKKQATAKRRARRVSTEAHVEPTAASFPAPRQDVVDPPPDPPPVRDPHWTSTMNPDVLHDVIPVVARMETARQSLQASMLVAASTVQAEQRVGEFGLRSVPNAADQVERHQVAGASDVMRNMNASLLQEFGGGMDPSLMNSVKYSDNYVKEQSRMLDLVRTSLFASHAFHCITFLSPLCVFLRLPICVHCTVLGCCRKVRDAGIVGNRSECHGFYYAVPASLQFPS